MDTKWVHIVGICGVTTSGVAVMFKQLGWHVTGSDKGFFPPVSDYLKLHGIEILPGFRMSRLYENNKHPDLIVYQGTKGDNNEEMTEAKRLKLPMFSFAEILRDYVIAQNSIVVAGSFGKTTTTAILVEIFKRAGFSISYMIGGLNPQMSPNVMPKDTTTRFSIVEGDEYLNTLADPQSKFFYFSPKYLVLTGIQYDHADLFPTFDAYLNNFKKLIELVPADGLLVANIDDQNVQKVISAAKCKVVTFSAKSRAGTDPDWLLLETSKPLPTMLKNPKDTKSELEIIPFERKFPGIFNDANILAATVLASELGIKKERIQSAIREFPGIKRRLEIVYQKDNRLVIDDFGAAPAKALSSLSSLKTEFKEHKIIAIFEPTAGNRVVNSLSLFNDVFKIPDQLVLPRFTLLPRSKTLRYTEPDFLEELQNHGVNATLIPDDNDLIKFLATHWFKEKNLIIVFLGSHSFRGMIGKLILELSNATQKNSTKKR